MNDLNKTEIIEILERMIPDYIETSEYAFKSLESKSIKNLKKAIENDIKSLSVINKLVNQYLEQ